MTDTPFLKHTFVYVQMSTCMCVYTCMCVHVCPQKYVSYTHELELDTGNLTLILYKE